MEKDKSNKGQGDKLDFSRVLATGTFDIFHVGHLDYLEYAKSFGDYLIVHIESDEAVKRHKGEKRPVNDQNDRRRIINSLKITDEAFIADGEKDAIEILKKYQPDVFVLASKSTFNEAEKEKEFQEILPNLKVVWFKKNSPTSSSKIIQELFKES